MDKTFAVTTFFVALFLTIVVVLIFKMFDHSMKTFEDCVDTGCPNLISTNS